MPKEFKRSAELLFSASQVTTKEVAAFASELGIDSDYRKCIAAKEQGQFLAYFKNNLYLLIQKTWVEKSGEDRKDRLKDRVPRLIDLIEKLNYHKALEEFAQILEELAWLLFGEQSRKDDFFEYAFRIDGQMGLFWWYAGRLERFLSTASLDNETLKAILLLGICYLTDF
ncbi:MAG: hypothetical protein LBJ31_03445 [Treponema sp.]|nr:hypothetical protein [Treponema sp.]